MGKGVLQTTFGSSPGDSLAVDIQGNVYIADPGSGSVMIHAPGTTGATNGPLTNYGGLAGVSVDGLGDEFIVSSKTLAEWNQGAVESELLLRTVQCGVGCSTGTLSNAVGLTVTPSGIVYVADNGNQTVWRYASGYISVANSSPIEPGTAGTDSVAFSFTQNQSTANRTGTITFNVGGQVTVTQLPGETLATLTSPTGGLTSTSQTFSWTSGVGVQEYWLWIGSTGPGSSNIYVGPPGTETSTTVSGLPINGETLYVRLFSLVNGTWQYNDYTFGAWLSPAAVMISPPNGSSIGSSQVFQWTTGTGVQQYQIWVGTTGPGSSNLYVLYPGNVTSLTVGGLPSNGSTLYVTLVSVIDGVSEYNYYTYVAAGQSPTGPAPQLFLQNAANSGVSDWVMGGSNSAAILSARWFATALPNWDLCAIADLNGDGVPDLVFQNTQNFQVSVWFMGGPGGNTILSSLIVYDAVPNWRVAAAADLNGDGVPDLILENAVTNQISVWFMNAGGMSLSSAPIIATAAIGWNLVATGDINQDGVPDLLFQNQTTGQISVWFMNAGGLSYSSAPIVASPKTGWALIGTSDFNGDGIPDYVFQNRRSGQVSVWYMLGTQGTTYSSAPVIATAAVGWYVIGAQ